MDETVDCMHKTCADLSLADCGKDEIRKGRKKERQKDRKRRTVEQGME